MRALADGVRSLAKAALAGAFHASGALDLLGAARRRIGGGPRVHLLAFHRVVDDLDALPPGVIRPLCITTTSFERVCRIARDRFDVMTLAGAADVVRGRRTVHRDVMAITFDDGYRDVYLRALPVLRALGLPATAFVPSGYVGAPRLLEHDRLHALLERAGRGHRDLARALPEALRPAMYAAERALYRGAVMGMAGPAGPSQALDVLIARLPAGKLAAVGDALEQRLGVGPGLDEGSYVMGPSELRACVEGGIEIGGHTVGHVVLTHEPVERVRRELVESREQLAAIAGRPCESFAYCNGFWHPEVVSAVREAGYAAAVTTCDVPNAVGGDPYLLGRKTLWEAHVRGLDGAFSEPHATAQLYDLFGDLALTRPINGRVERERDTATTHRGDTWPLRV